jgi:hypothetical protein
MPNSINMVHQSSTNVCHLLMYWSILIKVHVLVNIFESGDLVPNFPHFFAQSSNSLQTGGFS